VAEYLMGGTFGFGECYLYRYAAFNTTVAYRVLERVGFERKKISELGGLGFCREYADSIHQCTARGYRRGSVCTGELGLNER
jgi:hypothetical protein